MTTNAPALPSFGDESKANLFPFAVVCAAWVAPMLKFWVIVPSPLPPLLLTVALAAGLWWLPGSYYRTRKFETARLYEMLGVRAFRALVPNGDLVNRWRRRHDPRFRVVSSRSAAAAFLGRTITGEKTHLVSLVIGLGSSLFAWKSGWLGWAAYFAVANVVFNAYPILLQRYTRARIALLLTK